MGGQNEKCDVTSVLTSYAITSHHQHSAWPFSAADFAPILCSLSLSSSCRIEWNVLGTSFSVVFYDFEYVSFCLFGIIFISFVSRWIYEWAKWRNANTHIPKEPFVGLNFHIKSHQNLPPFSTWVDCVLHNACYVLKWFAFRSFIFTRVAVFSLKKNAYVNSQTRLFLHRETKQVKCFKYSNSSGEILFLSAFRFYYCAWCWMLDLFISQHSVVSARSFATYSEEYFYLPGFV